MFEKSSQSDRKERFFRDFHNSVVCGRLNQIARGAEITMSYWDTPDFIAKPDQIDPLIQSGFNPQQAGDAMTPNLRVKDGVIFRPAHFRPHMIDIHLAALKTAPRPMTAPSG